MTVNELYDIASLFDFWTNKRALFTVPRKETGILGRNLFVSLGGLDFLRYKTLLKQSFNYTSTLARDKKIPYNLDARCTTLANLSDNGLFELHNILLKQRENLVSSTLDKFGNEEVKSLDDLIHYHQMVIKAINEDPALKKELDIDIFGHRYFLPDLALYSYLVYMLDDKGIKKLGGYVDISSLTAWNQDLSWVFLKTLLSSDHRLALCTRGNLLVNTRVKEEREIDMLVFDQYIDVTEKCVNLDEMKVTMRHKVENYSQLFTDFSALLDRILSFEEIKKAMATDILGDKFNALGSLGTQLPYPMLYALHQFFIFLDLLTEKNSISNILDIAEMENKDIILKSYLW